ncbi:MAG: CPBP family intramembrane metalloprotease [Candidatus Cloacimonetes bacterium]|nr:CPBP family intramembrane metalloprotease [Candidatus Cloacimonadota bacterium]MBL7086141.1 CPBP family intramembrane metalloprotease [Candidatus Cloacimonadota bacterium]
MKNSLRLILTIILWVCIYFLAVFVIPPVSFIAGFIKSHAWISNGDVSQITFLITSLILMYLLSKGKLSTFGFQSVKISKLAKSVLIAFIFSFVLIVLNIIMMAIAGPATEGGEHPGINGGMLKTIISVWILASICEEIFCRGLIQGFLAPLKKYGFKLFKSYISVPVAVSAILFGLGHFCLWGRMPNAMVIFIIINATILGIIAGYHREKTGSIIPAIAVHMTFNIVGFMIPMLLMKVMMG